MVYLLVCAVFAPRLALVRFFILGTASLFDRYTFHRLSPSLSICMKSHDIVWLKGEICGYFLKIPSGNTVGSWRVVYA